MRVNEAKRFFFKVLKVWMTSFLCCWTTSWRFLGPKKTVIAGQTGLRPVTVMTLLLQSLCLSLTVVAQGTTTVPSSRLPLLMLLISRLHKNSLWTNHAESTVHRIVCQTLLTAIEEPVSWTKMFQREVKCILSFNIKIICLHLYPDIAEHL